MSKRSPTDLEISAINTIFNLPPGLHDMPAFGVAMDKATEALLQRLGDAEAVCGSRYESRYTSDLDLQLQQLNHASLLVLLMSDKLKARSENNVLMMADMWVINSPAGKSCNPAQLCQVAEAIRMGQLSNTSSEWFHGFPGSVSATMSTIFSCYSSGTMTQPKLRLF